LLGLHNRQLSHFFARQSNLFKQSLRNLDGTDAIPLDASLSYYIHSSFQTAIWLPNGTAVLLAFEPKQRAKISAYIVSPDGKLTKWEKLSQIMKNYAHFLVISPDGKNLYWRNESCPTGGGQCKPTYYLTKLDDSEQKRILYNVYSFQDMYISPSGQYIVYLDNSYQVLKGCFIYNVADGTVTKIASDKNPKGLGYYLGKILMDILFQMCQTGKLQPSLELMQVPVM
jgi:hypothetical protein